MNGAGFLLSYVVSCFLFELFSVGKRTESV